MLPWTDIPLPDPQAAYSYILADIDHPYEFFWARDRKGAYAFRFKGKFPLEGTEGAPEMSGISTSGELLGGSTYFNLVLQSNENAEIFLTLCRSLMSATSIISADHDAAALEMVLTRLRRWQEILKSGGNKTLSLEKQIGLFGELLVLKDLFIANLEPFEAVSCWNGPLGDEQDFGYSDSLVEVKTARSTRDREFTVSSLAQLDTTSGNITVVFQTLGVFEDAPPNGLSLNGMVRDVKRHLSGHGAAISELDTRLALSGYVEDADYDRCHFVPASRRLFAVRDEFPRIEAKDVRVGIAKARYEVQLEDCLRFELAPDVAIARILEDVKETRLRGVKVAPDELVRMEESSELEFKSSLRWSYSDAKVDPALEQVVLKAIASLTNTRGGVLVIGVANDHGVLGLEMDYSTLRATNRDGFEQHLYQLLNKAFGAVFCTQCLALEFASVAGKEICIVRVERADRIVAVEKIDKSGQKSKVYYVRMGNSSKELDAADVIAYHERRR